MPLRRFIPRHEFTAGNGFDGWCEVRIFDGTPESGGLPIVMLSEPEGDSGPSVTNTVEQLAAEVFTRYLGEQDGLEPPFLVIEHYYDRNPERYHEDFFEEHFDRVTFADYKVHRRVVRGADGPHVYVKFGSPTWDHVKRAEVERLVGEPLPWPECSCAHNPRRQRA